MTEYSVDVRRAAARLMEGGWAGHPSQKGLQCGRHRPKMGREHTGRAEARVLFGMGSEHRAYDYETKLAAVRDHLGTECPSRL